MRIALVLVLALAGCASKKAVKAPAPVENAAPGGGATQDSEKAAAPDGAGGGGSTGKTGDPCDGGEAQKQKK